MSNKKKLLVKTVVVIGAGPAGVATALSLKSQGVDVLLVEKEPYGRHRIGEILLTQTVLELAQLGVADEISEYAEKLNWGKKYAAAYVYGEDRTPWIVRNNHPLASSEDQPHIPRSFVNKETKLWYTLMVRRHEFDEAMREIAQKREIDLLVGNVKDLHFKDETRDESSLLYKIDVETPDGELVSVSARFFVDATGQQALIPRRIGQRNVVDDWNLQARYTYFKGVDFEKAQSFGLLKDGANILSYEDGWSWIAHLGNDITSAGIVSKVWDKEQNSFFEKFKRLPEYEKFGFANATVVNHLGETVENPKEHYAHPNYRFRSTVMRGKNWACVGDAAMFLDPLLSQGVTLALSFGRRLGEIVKTIIAGDSDSLSALSSYEREYISEIEVLNKVISQWYKPDFIVDETWSKTARKINNIFGRNIGSDVEAFRWVSNLENIHFIMKDKNDANFLKTLNDVNNIKQIHNYEGENKYGF